MICPFCMRSTGTETTPCHFVCVSCARCWTADPYSIINDMAMATRAMRYDPNWELCGITMSEFGYRALIREATKRFSLFSMPADEVWSPSFEGHPLTIEKRQRELFTLNVGPKR